MPKTNRVYDQLIQADLGRSFTGMYAAVDRLQTVNPGEQVAAVAILFRLLCERYDLDIQDVFTAVGRMIFDAHYQQAVQLNAARQYIKEQLQ